MFLSTVSYYIQTTTVNPSQDLINEINTKLQDLKLQAPNINLTSVSDFYKNCNDTDEYNAKGVIVSFTEYLRRQSHKN